LTFVVLAAVLACLVVGQEGLNLTMDQVMSPSELRETGVASLNPAQKAALNAWLNRYTHTVARIISKSVDSQSDPASKIPVHTSCSPAIESNIEGEFQGWDGETIFKLANGQIWQQAEYDYDYEYDYSPDVTIYAVAGGCRMKVQDVDDTILVKRIK
jgi:hypothetical protein